MEQYMCNICQKGLRLSDVAGVNLNNWRWFSWKNYFYQAGISAHFLLILELLLKYFKY